MRLRTHSYRSLDSSLESFGPLYDSGTWEFTFHASCWEILCERTSDDPSQSSHLATLLHSMLYCTPCNKYKYLRPGHDYGGAAEFQKPVGNPLNAMIRAGLSHFAAEPSKVVHADHTSCCLGHTTEVSERSTDEVATSERASASDIFSKMPPDIVYLLLAWLNSDDIQQLRLASRSIAILSSTKWKLPQSFWKSRFSAEFEMGFALPTHIDREPRDWRALYSALKHELQAPQPSLVLQNRRRIWKLVGKNASLFSLHL